MKIPRTPHPWALSPRRAAAVQRRLAPRVVRRPPPRAPRLVAGLDAAFSRDGRHCLAAAVLWDVEACAVVEEQVARRPLAFPYVPGLLTFREGPALLAALRRLRRRADALFFDGHGLSHPRRFGIASHLGVVTDLPSVGCAKSRLVGEHREPGARRGARTPLRHEREEIGAVLRTREGARPIYVSIGHRVDLESAVEWVLRCGAGYRLPEPTRRADRRVALLRREAMPRPGSGAPSRAAPRR